MNNYSLSIKIIVLLVISSQYRSILATENPCSCYTFHTIYKDWRSSNKHCQQNGGNLVSMETEEEYQFINKTIQSRNDGDNEWYIGLRNNTGEWEWISNHSLTIDKWQPNEPNINEKACVVMAKNWPSGYYGLFKDERHDVGKMFICEYKTGNCNRTNTAPQWCSANTDSKVTSTLTSLTETGTRQVSQPPSTLSQKQQSTTTAKPTSLSETSTKQKPLTTTSKPESPSKHARSYWPKNTNQKPSSTEEKDESPNTSQRKKQTTPFSMIIVTITLGIALLLSVCLLVFAYYWKRRNRDSKCEKKNQETNEMLTEVGHPPTSDQCSENTDPTEVVQLFHPKNGESYVTYAVIHNNLTQQNQGSADSKETAAYASIEETKMARSNSKKKDPYTPMPVAGSTEGGEKGNTEVVYASVDKKKSKIATQGTSKKTMASNEENETQDDKQWSEGQQVVYASVDKSKNKPGINDVLYAEVENKVNTDKQQQFQITYAELADLKHNAQEAAAVKPVPYQPVEYAVIIGQKNTS